MTTLPFVALRPSQIESVELGKDVLIRLRSGVQLMFKNARVISNYGGELSAGPKVHADDVLPGLLPGYDAKPDAVVDDRVRDALAALLALGRERKQSIERIGAAVGRLNGTQYTTETLIKESL